MTTLTEKVRSKVSLETNWHVKETAKHPVTGNVRSKDGKDYYVRKNLTKAEAEKHARNLGGSYHGVYVVQESVDGLEEGLWADKKKAWMATFENNVVSRDSSHQGKIDWNTAQYLHKQQHTPSSAADAYLKAKGEKRRGVTFEEVELEEGNVPKVQGFSNFKQMAQDWANNNTHHGKTNIKKHDAVLPNGKIMRQTVSLGHANNGQTYIIGVFNHEGKDSENGFGWHHHRDQGINESVNEAFSDTVKKVGKNLAARPNKGAMPAACRVKKMTEEEVLDEGRVKELAMDLDGPDSLHDTEFVKKYGKSKDEWRAMLSPKPKTSIPNKMQQMYADKIKEDADYPTLDEEVELQEGLLSWGADKLDKMYQNHVAADVDMVGKRVTLDHGGEKGGAGTVTKSVRGVHSVRWDKGNSPRSKSGVSYSWQSQHLTSHLKPIKEDAQLQEATMPKYDPAKMDEFEASREYQYHAGQAAFHRNTQGWTGKFNDIYNRDWKKEAAHHERHMKALKQVIDYHKTRKEEAELQEGGSLLHKVKTLARKIDPTIKDRIAINKATPKAIDAQMDAHPDNPDRDMAASSRHLNQAHRYQRLATGQKPFMKKNVGAEQSALRQHALSPSSSHHTAVAAQKIGLAPGRIAKYDALSKKRVKEDVDLQEGPSLADMRPDNINSIIKQHGKRHMIYTGPGEPMQHGLGVKDLKSKLGIGTSSAVHKKLMSHLEKNGFKSSWSHSTNEWVVHPK